MDVSTQTSPLGEISRISSNRKNSQWYIAWMTLRRNPLAMAGLIGLLLLLIVIVIGPSLAPYSPTQMDVKNTMSPPSSSHLFGTDELGRDILSRVLYGGQISLLVAFLVVIIAMGGGTLLGLLVGYYGGLLDMLIMRVVDILLAFPTILLLFSIVAAIGPSLPTVMISLAVTNIPGFSRIMRGSVLSNRNNEYVTAARLIGASNWRIMIRHILPNIIPIMIIYATLGLGSAIMITAGLSYLGLGAQPPSPEWGAMLLAGRTYLRDAWWMSIFPGLAIVWAVLCVNLLGDGLRDALDPRLKNLR